jgi:hypothetical protein
MSWSDKSFCELAHRMGKDYTVPLRITDVYVAK